MSMPDPCTPEELHDRLSKKETPILLDVREDEEWDICHFENALHVPMGDIPSRLQDLDKYAEDEIIVYCHHGIRSANVQNYLTQQGFTNVRNLTGGIDAYAIRVDPEMKRY